MKLYFHPISQHSRRVLMAAEELGIELETETVALDKGVHKSERFLALNPAGQVPVLQDDGVVLAESHAIMKYLAAKNGETTLYPVDAVARATIDRGLDWNHTNLNPPVQAIAIQTFVMGENADQTIVARSHEQAQQALTVLGCMIETGAVRSSDITLADISIATTVALYEMIGGDVTSNRAVENWYDTIKARPSFRNTAPPVN